MPKIPFDDSPEFRRLLAGDVHADLTLIALEIAGDAYPQVDPLDYLARIDAMAQRIRDRCRDGANLRQILGQINWVLFQEENFQGDHESYYDPRNSYLNQVIDRRLGIPISLSALYLAVAERVGLAMAGVNLPGHFILRAGHGAGTVFVDPFHGGRLLDREGCARQVKEVTGQVIPLSDASLAPCQTSEVVARMLRNLKAIYLKEGDFPAAVPVLRRLASLTSDPLERRDLGVACLRAERAGEAIDHLQAYLDSAPAADDAPTVVSLLRAARREVASWN